jgi:hypothetical protein
MIADDSLPDDVAALKTMLRSERAARLAAEAEALAHSLFTSDGDSPQFTFGGVVGQANPSVIQEAREVYQREGIELEVSTLADWVGAAAATLMPVVEMIQRWHL